MKLKVLQEAGGDGGGGWWRQRWCCQVWVGDWRVSRSDGVCVCRGRDWLLLTELWPTSQILPLLSSSPTLSSLLPSVPPSHTCLTTTSAAASNPLRLTCWLSFSSFYFNICPFLLPLPPSPSFAINSILNLIYHSPHSYLRPPSRFSLFSLMISRIYSLTPLLLPYSLLSIILPYFLI